jgi:DNA-binding MarR family transcriptional regulator
LLAIEQFGFLQPMPKETPESEPEPRRLPPLLRRAWYSLNQTFRKRIAHLEITPDQYSVLRWLQEGDARGLTQQCLTELMASDPNTITSIVYRMEKAGLISRHPHESDRRARRVRLEAKGRQVFSAALDLAKDLQAQVLQTLPMSRRETFLRDLERVADACLAAQSTEHVPRDESKS